MSEAVETTINPYLEGNFAPVTEEVTAFDLPVEGELPKELNGRYLRNGPNPFSDVDNGSHHWFVGAGMVHGLRLREGQLFTRPPENSSIDDTSLNRSAS